MKPKKHQIEFWKKIEASSIFAFLLDLPTSHLCVEIAANAEQIYILVTEPGNLNIKISIETLFRIRLSIQRAGKERSIWEDGFRFEKIRGRFWKGRENRIFEATCPQFVLLLNLCQNLFLSSTKHNFEFKGGESSDRKVVREIVLEKQQLGLKAGWFD